MSLKSLYGLRKPTDRSALHRSRRILPRPRFIFLIFPVCLSCLHILSHAPSLLSHLFSLSITCLHTLVFFYVFALRSPLLISHFQLFSSSHVPANSSDAHQPIITLDFTARVFITCWTTRSVRLLVPSVLLLHLFPPIHTHNFNTLILPRST